MQYTDEVHGRLVDCNGIKRDVSCVIYSDGEGSPSFSAFGLDGSKINTAERLESCGRWAELLIEQPSFVMKCNEYNGWGTFDGLDWSLLLRKRPQFIEKCNEFGGWDLMIKDMDREIVQCGDGEYEEDDRWHGCTWHSRVDAIKDMIYKYSLSLDEAGYRDYENSYHGIEDDWYPSDPYYGDTFIRDRRDGLFQGIFRVHRDFIPRFKEELNKRFFVCLLKAHPMAAASEYERLDMWNRLDLKDWMEVLERISCKTLYKVMKTRCGCNFWNYVKLFDSDIFRKIIKDEEDEDEEESILGRIKEE